MHIEERKRGKKKIFYLAHSFRENGKVRKMRRLIGSDLSEKEIEKLRPNAEAALIEQIENYMKINDPLKTVLSKEDEEKIKNIISEKSIKINHLSEDEWTKFTEEFTYDTNAIEGSTVTSQEVTDILKRDRWPKERSKWEISETYGVAGAVKYIRKTREHLSLGLISELHKIVFGNSKEFAGKLREAGVEVAVIDRNGNVMHRGAPQRQIVSLLKELVDWYGKNREKYHPLVLASVVHNQFENIHPFQDGNGRIGRLLLNNILIKHGMPPVNIEFESRSEYYASLQAYEREGNLRPSIELILKEYTKLKRLLKNG